MYTDTSLKLTPIYSLKKYGFVDEFNNKVIDTIFHDVKLRKDEENYISYYKVSFENKIDKNIAYKDFQFDYLSGMLSDDGELHLYPLLYDDYDRLVEYYRNLLFYLSIPTSYFDTEHKITTLICDINYQMLFMYSIIGKYVKDPLTIKVRKLYKKAYTLSDNMSARFPEPVYIRSPELQKILDNM